MPEARKHMMKLRTIRVNRAGEFLASVKPAKLYVYISDMAKPGPACAKITQYGNLYYNK